MLTYYFGVVFCLVGYGLVGFGFGLPVDNSNRAEHPIQHCHQKYVRKYFILILVTYLKNFWKERKF